MKAYFYSNVITFDYSKLQDYYFEQTGELDFSERDHKRVKTCDINLKQLLHCVNRGRKLLEAE